MDDTGKVGYFTGTATGQEIILPELGTPETEGLSYKFKVGNDYAGSSRIIWPYPGSPTVDADSYQGSVNWIANGGATAVSADNYIVFSGSASPGDFIEVTSFDDKWYVSGQCKLDNSIEWGPPPGLDPCASFSLNTTIVASDAAASDFFAHSVAIFGDYAIVGAHMEGTGGSAYIFLYNGSAWVQDKKLLASDTASGDQFGWSVAISGDIALGEYTAVVGARHENGNIGSAYVFEKDLVNGWSSIPTQKIVPSDGNANDYFGTSVAISWPDYLICGSPQADPSSTGQGAAYIFERSNTWSEAEIIVSSSPSSNAYFGSCVGISGDYAVVGSPYRKAPPTYETESGIAEVYERDGLGAWNHEVLMTKATPLIGAKFGKSCSINGDTVIIGSDTDWEGGSNYQGGIWIFNRSGGSWPSTPDHEKLGESGGDRYGFSVSNYADDLVVGAYYKNIVGSTDGAAYIYNRNCGGPDTWGVVNSIQTSASGDNLGTSVGINLNNIILGAPKTGTDQGTAYVYERA